MEMGCSFDEALLETQRRGLSEQNPWVDIDGLEAAAKTVIVAKSLMGLNVGMNQVHVKGIRNVTTQAIEDAKRRGGKLKLLSRVEVNAGDLDITVNPEILSMSHPLAYLEGFSVGALLLTDMIGEICVSGSGSGPNETSYSLLRDLLSLKGR
jgi:homoserine dehydrogenase